MEDHKFSNSNLDFNELFDKYKTLNTTYSDSDIVDFKINIYENCNLLQNLTTTFTVPSTNIRLSSFKNNYIIADTQSLNLNQAFYNSNTSLFDTFPVGNVTYINNINLTNIIKTHFNYNNDDIYPSKKIIITINLPNEIVDTDGSGALQIDMEEIKEHFHSLFDTLELNINQYVTGKHGELEDTVREPPNNVKGGNGQNAILNSAGPAINITNNDTSYFKLNIITNGKVSGGFGASGGRGGDGKINETPYARNDAFTNNDGPHFSTFASGRAVCVVVLTVLKFKIPTGWYFENTTTFYWDGNAIKTISGDDTSFANRTSRLEDGVSVMIPPDVTPATYPESSAIQESYDATSNTYTKKTLQFLHRTKQNGHDRIVASNADSTWITRWSIMKSVYTYTKTGVFAPTPGNTGFTANYSNNAQYTFDTQPGNTGTPNNGEGGTGGARGNRGDITNIANIEEVDNIDIIDS